MFETIVAQRPRHVTIVAIGPLTNVALLLKCYPEVRLRSNASSRWAAQSVAGT